MTEEERQPPRFQDTTERAALPVPLPGSEAEPEVDPPASVEEPASTDGSESSTDETPALDPLLAPPAAESFAVTDGGAEPARPEILIGAAFLGGVALALVLKRLGS
ncbi:MAG: hypothetical protein M3155_06540 [Actinomycetota bacterium]|nr:hypothetical protein [Actinomycetota bacterium]